MGRPLHERNFGAQAGDQIKVRAKIGAGAEGDGIIVRQKGTKMYDVTVGGITGRCMLVDKANGSLLANEMSITVLNDVGASLRVTKLMGRVASLNDGTRAPWTYATSAIDGKVDLPEATDLLITVQPADFAVTAPDTHTFSVTATATPAEAITYQWYLDGALIGGATSASYTTPATTVGTYEYYVVVSSATGGSVTSDVATLTVTA